MNIVLFIVFLIIGIILYSIGICQILSELTCSIPMTRRTVPQCKHLVDTDGIYKYMALHIIYRALISAFAIWAVLKWGNNYVITGFFIGFAISFFISIGGLGINPKSYLNYFKNYHMFYARNDLEDLGIIGKKSENV